MSLYGAAPGTFKPACLSLRQSDSGPFSEMSLKMRYQVIQEVIQFRKTQRTSSDKTALGKINGWLLPDAPLTFFTTMLSEEDWRRSIGTEPHERTRFLVDAAQEGYRMTDESGFGPLLWAAQNSSFLTAELGLSLAALDRHPNRKDRHRRMDALGFVMAQGRPTKELVEILLDVGCDPTQRSNVGCSLFAESCLGRTTLGGSLGADLTPEVVDLLASKGMEFLQGPEELVRMGRRDAAQIAEAVLLGWTAWKTTREKLEEEGGAKTVVYGPDWGR